MKNSLRQLVVAIFCVGLLFRADAGEGSPGGTRTISFLDDGVCIRVPVRVFDETLYFVVDTGTSVPIFDTRFLERLGPPTGQGHINTGVATVAGASFYSCPDLSVAGLQVTADRALCQSLRMVQMIIGERCDGILGMSFFKDYVLTIDFDSRTMAFAKTVDGELRKKAIALPLSSIRRSHVAVEAVLNNTYPATLMVDSSDSSSISLNPADWERVFGKAENPNIRTVTMAVVGGETRRSSIARIGSIKLGGIEQRNLICALTPNPDTPSTIGVSFLRRYITAFDFPNDVLYLVPSKHCNDPENPDMSGLHLLREDAGTVVASVDGGSTAAEVGIEPGDRMLKINTREAGSLSMATIRQLLKSADNPEVRLEIEHSSATKSVTLHLQKTL